MILMMMDDMENEVKNIQYIIYIYLTLKYIKD
jgi:hypothetical protein